ncbi:DUF5698 domain-containing protein [Bacillus sp. 1NLA3E]|uniref:DUF5698 domain-containing protein n=1 Tax=Bacillus sp. 1NLA3E TaxID=666686 RepID=UPI000247E2BB|nr:DUF5698 domain-containing protein [Bacillus sp. 1NLA3E]AGK55985.1 hypothetical protein B1NLA3E_21235 [Bacillus sp. 1NLA3E]
MLNIILIIVLQLIYVPIYTLRTLFLVKNITVLAAIMGIIETLIYVFGLSLIFNGDKSFTSMIVYSIGFGIGIILGTRLEQKLALGYIIVTVNTPMKNSELVRTLRENGFGVTLYTGEGMDSDRYRMEILTKRNRERELIATVERFETNAFIVSYEPKRFKGGYIFK